MKMKQITEYVVIKFSATVTIPVSGGVGNDVLQNQKDVLWDDLYDTFHSKYDYGAMITDVNIKESFIKIKSKTES